MDLRGVTLIYGRPGTGKTALAASIAHERLKNGERVFWVSLHEDEETLMANAAKLGYDLSKAEIWEAVLADPEAVFNHIIAAVSELAPSLLVVDSISQLAGLDLRTYVTNAVYRALRPAGTDVVLTCEEESAGPLAYIADNIVHLTRRVAGNGVVLRQMDFEKLRGRQAGGVRAFEIIEGAGVVLLDELRASFRRPHAVYPTGIRGLDEMLGGGLASGSVNVLLASYTPTALRLLSAAVAGLSKSGARVLFAARSMEPGKAEELARRMGGGAEARPVDVKPEAYAWATYSLYKALEEVQPDVVVTDWLDVDFAVYGPEEALRAFLRNARILREAGVALLAVSSRDYIGLFSDSVVSLEEGGEAAALRAVKTAALDAPRLCKIDVRTLETSC